MEGIPHIAGEHEHLKICLGILRIGDEEHVFSKAGCRLYSYWHKIDSFIYLYTFIYFLDYFIFYFLFYLYLFLCLCFYEGHNKYLFHHNKKKKILW